MAADFMMRLKSSFKHQRQEEQQQQHKEQRDKQPLRSVLSSRNGVTASPGERPRIRFEQDDSSSESDASVSMLRAARAGHLDKVLEYVDQGTDINTCNQNGLNALHLASKEGHVTVVRELLARGAAVDSVTRKGNAAIHVASLAGREEVVQQLIQTGANVNAQSENGFTPLYMAAQENHQSVVQLLLANGANQSITTEDGFTPLAVALQQGHDAVVRVLLESDSRGKVRLPALHVAAKKNDCKAAMLLLQNESNADVTSRSGFTPLHIAAHYGNENMATLLIDKGADVNYMAKHQITALHVAAKWGQLSLCVLLCERGGSVEASTRDGLTALHCAARSGHHHVVQLLLNNSAFISAKTKNGLTPLHMAAQGDHVHAARVLFHHKVPVDDVTVDYLTALHVAAHCGHVAVAQLLLERGADVNSRALNGFTPLHIACKKNRVQVVQLLLQHSASIHATTESGLTPLHVASFMGCMEIVLLLAQHGASCNEATVRGETALHLAARANQADIVRILLRNQAQVDAAAREQQTALHIASRLGNVDIVMMLLQHGASVDATTKDNYTALHIAAKEGQDEVAHILMENGASVNAETVRGFSPLHLSAKHNSIGVAKLLLARGAQTDAVGKNGVTPLHVASHYDHQKMALLLLEKGASVHATARNGYTPLHVAAKKNQMDIATCLLEYGANSRSVSKAGYSPLHLAALASHADMCSLLLSHGADADAASQSGLCALHLAAQQDAVCVAAVLVKHGCQLQPRTAAHYTPLHVAAHFGHANMARFLLQHQAQVDCVNNAGYTPLHHAAQQGHTLVINLLLQNRATPDATTNSGQTALSIAEKLGYISVVETLKVVTETTVTTTTTTTTTTTEAESAQPDNLANHEGTGTTAAVTAATGDHKYRVLVPETMHETFLSDSEDEAAEEEPAVTDAAYKYVSVDEMKSLGDDSMPIDTSRDDTLEQSRDFWTDCMSGAVSVEDMLDGGKNGVAGRVRQNGRALSSRHDLTAVNRSPITAGFLVSFMVDARGGAMRGCRHSGVRVIVPPRKAAQPMRVTCRYLKKDKLLHPPPLMEGEALASRILEMGPAQAKFLGPVILEVPHFASLRGRQREVVVLRCDDGRSWREHSLEASEDAVQQVLNDSFDGHDLKQLDDLNTSRITRILTSDFPQYFALVSRLRQEIHGVGPEGGMVSSTVVPQVQAVFPPAALTKKIKVGLQAHPLSREMVACVLGTSAAASPIVTIEPRRRKFHKPITLTIPVPQAACKGMINECSGDTPSLRLLCSISGGSTLAQWEDVTGSTPLTFVQDCVSFTTTVSARFWLVDCRHATDTVSLATELYRQANLVPFMAKFVVFAKRHDPLEGRVRVFCMTDDKEDKTLEQQEHFVEVAKSRDVEVMEGKPLYLEFAGNLVPVTKSGQQLSLKFGSFRENRLPFNVRVRDSTEEPMARVTFMKDKMMTRDQAPQSAVCSLNVQLPSEICADASVSADSGDLLCTSLGRLTPASRSLFHMGGMQIHRADMRIVDIGDKLAEDWPRLASQLGVRDSDIQLIQNEYDRDVKQQATVMLRLWMNNSGPQATGNRLAEALQAVGRADIVLETAEDAVQVTDPLEAVTARSQLDQSGFETLQDELAQGSSSTGHDVKYSTEQKTSRAVVTPRDLPVTGQVTVSDLRSSEDESPVVASSVTSAAAAVDNRRQGNKQLVLDELGEALVRMEKSQPPLSTALTKMTSSDLSSAVAEPEVVVQDKSVRSAVTATAVVTTAAVQQSRTTSHTPPDLTAQRPHQYTRATIQQQTSDTSSNFESQNAPVSTTITTTSLEGGVDVAITDSSNAHKPDVEADWSAGRDGTATDSAGAAQQDHTC